MTNETEEPFEHCFELAFLTLSGRCPIESSVDRTERLHLDRVGRTHQVKLLGFLKIIGVDLLDFVRSDC